MGEKSQHFFVDKKSPREIFNKLSVLVWLLEHTYQMVLRDHSYWGQRAKQGQQKHAKQTLSMPTMPSLQSQKCLVLMF